MADAAPPLCSLPLNSLYCDDVNTSTSAFVSFSHKQDASSFTMGFIHHTREDSVSPDCLVVESLNPVSLEFKCHSGGRGVADMRRGSLCYLETDSLPQPANQKL
ncbi:hypothetical protein EYF80_043493 [Liparis tanakae]|uniref:Uncharacterized protein n=1 Tax=Liparis tanakae TaxID=230148 RepID=A0A4Z2FZN2_9TELE|nr:hypothetical protein EYF80_043493 [Liparis tanakae]